MKRLTHSLCLLLLAVALQGCVAYRFVGHGTEGIDDFKTFPTDTIHPAAEPFRFAKVESVLLDTMRLKVERCEEPLTLRQMIDTLDSRNASAGIVVVQNDTIRFEHYRGMVGPDSHTTIFSVTKSVTSLLVGMAIDKGFISSVEDAVTRYLPELAERDPMFGQLTIENLLDMRTGLAFSENYSANPLSGMARLHYGRHIEGQIRSQHFKKAPDTEFEYNSMATAIVGAVLERATGRRYADLLEEWVWKPLGMERYALMNLDDYQHRFAKAYGGLSTTPRDMARFGRLYLNGGEWEGVQLVDKKWVERSLSAERATRNGWYTNSWRTVPAVVYIDGERNFEDPTRLADLMVEAHEKYHIPIELMRAVPNDDGSWSIRAATDCFYAYGLHGQVVFIDPAKRIIAVYMGNDRVDNFPTLFYRMAERMKK